MRETPAKTPPRELFVRDLMPARPDPYVRCGPKQVTTLAVGEEEARETHR